MGCATTHRIKAIPLSPTPLPTRVVPYGGPTSIVVKVTATPSPTPPLEFSEALATVAAELTATAEAVATVRARRRVFPPTPVPIIATMEAVATVQELRRQQRALTPIPTYIPPRSAYQTQSTYKGTPTPQEYPERYGRLSLSRAETATYSCIAMNLNILAASAGEMTLAQLGREAQEFADEDELPLLPADLRLVFRRISDAIAQRNQSAIRREVDAFIDTCQKYRPE